MLRRKDARMRYSVAYPTGAERIKISRDFDACMQVVIVR